MGESEYFFGSRRMSVEDIDEESRIIVEEFVQFEIENEGLPRDSIPVTPPATPLTPVAKQRAISMGGKLREIADEFRNSPFRQKVRETAYRAPLGNRLSYESYCWMAQEFFDEGITRERIIVFFYFSSDLVVRCIKNKLIDMCQKLIDWVVKFVHERLAMWVLANGGWAAVLETSMRKVSFRWVIAGAIVLISLIVAYKGITR